jgi:repressor LexA
VEKLKKRKQQILDFIKSFIAKNGYAPTLREIASGLSLASAANIHTHLNNLKKQGFIDWEPDKPRTIKVLNFPNGDGPR